MEPLHLECYMSTVGDRIEELYICAHQEPPNQPHTAAREETT